MLKRAKNHSCSTNIPINIFLVFCYKPDSLESGDVGVFPLMSRTHKAPSSVAMTTLSGPDQTAEIRLDVIGGLEVNITACI